jgi:hypothetical protein
MKRPAAVERLKQIVVARVSDQWLARNWIAHGRHDGEVKRQRCG